MIQKTSLSAAACPPGQVQIPADQKVNVVIARRLFAGNVVNGKADGLPEGRYLKLTVDQPFDKHAGVFLPRGSLVRLGDGFDAKVGQYFAKVGKLSIIVLDACATPGAPVRTENLLEPTK